MKRLWTIFLVLFFLTIILWWTVFDYNSRRTETILKAWTDLEMEVVREAARATKAWMQLRIEQDGVSIDTAEQEVFKKFIEPILLLKNGDAWIYNRNYVIFDKSSDFPDIYRGKSIRQIFKTQKEKGAYHYDELCDGVTNATEGTSWYVWLPDKGREFVAWTSVRLVNDTWTIGLSTPEPEILEYSGINTQFKRELAGAIFITCLLLTAFFLILIQNHRDRAMVKLLEQSVDNQKKEIKERKKAQEALLKSEKQSRCIIDSIGKIGEGLFIVNRDMSIQYMNDVMIEWFGNQTGKICYQSLFDLASPPSYCKIKTVIEDGKTVQYESATLDGRILNIVSTPFYNQDGSVSKMGVVRDITFLKKAEKEKKKLQEQLIRSKKMEALGLLAGGVAHDLNNILSALVGYPELLLMKDNLDDTTRKSLEAIYNCGLKASAVVSDLIMVAKGVAINKEPMNFNNTVKEYMFSPELRMLEHLYPEVKFKTRLDPDLLNINGSDIHILKALMNLVSNAFEAVKIEGGPGTVTISTQNTYVDKPVKRYDEVRISEYAVLSVSDTGSAISEDDLERVFEPFYTKKIMGRSGTGLGLAVVWNTVQDHKGYVNVGSDENGTEFKLYFPITRDELYDKDLSSSLEELKGSGETILVIDDEAGQRKITCKMLDTLGYKTSSVSGGEEAVEYLKKNSVDLLVLDMIMDPGINGRETYKRIIKIHPGQKAIIASGFAETDEVKEAQKLGAGRYIKKPLTLERIGLAVKEELEK